MRKRSTSIRTIRPAAPGARVGTLDAHHGRAESAPAGAGDATTLDGFNTTFEQYFAQTLNDETLQARVSDTLAQTMTQQIAIWFRNHNMPEKAAPDELPRYLNTDRMPDDNGNAATDRTGVDGFPASATGRLSRSTTSTSAQ